MKQLTLFALLVLALGACKKDKNDDPQPGSAQICLVDSLISEGSIQKHYYDAQNRLVKTIGIGTDTFIQNLEYNGNVVVVKIEGQDGEQVVYLNSKGFMDSLVYEIPLGSIHGKVTYNASGQMTQLEITGEILGTVLDQITTYEWLNGDIANETTVQDGDTTTVTHTYDVTKSNSLAALETRLSFLPSSAHLITKSVYFDDTEITYAYLLDANNKVIKKITTDADGPSDEFYTWVCK
jgi:hypothetical protein